jgi:hypothetical protein
MTATIKHPFYPLRKNKAVERLIFIDAIRRLENTTGELSGYTYYGMGGPFLEDFRIMHEFFPYLDMVSIEGNEETYKRQKFHRPCSTKKLKLKRNYSDSFIASQLPVEKKFIFWLDYTGFELSHIEDFVSLVSKAPKNSMIKITVEADVQKYYKDGSKQDEFYRIFDRYLLGLPGGFPLDSESFSRLILEMLKIAAQEALPASFSNVFQPISSFYYADGANMLTLTGLICDRNGDVTIPEAFKTWDRVNLGWDTPKEINLPDLSPKERLGLQKKFPCNSSYGEKILRSLGYLIDDDRDATLSKLEQYADFYRYYPYFMKAIP